MLLPHNKASMFRGGFGNVFKKLNCINRLSKTCKDCPIQNTCAYCYIFEPGTNIDIPRPYVIEVPFFDKRSYKKDEIVTFNLILIGKATEYIAHFIFAFIELGKTGLTKQNFKYELKQVTDDKNNVVFKNNNILSKGLIFKADKIIEEKIQKIQGDKLTFNFTTPLRIVTENNLITEPSFELMVKNLTRRITLLSKYHHTLPTDIDYKSLIEKSKNIKLTINNMQWFDWVRYSSRQKRKMTFGGLIGTITYAGNFDDFKPYLILGEHIHIGKNCTFGQGKYTVL
jgi:hypothetical protein